MLKSKRFFVHMLVIVMAFSLTSCFHMAEEIFFRKNGSGNYSFTLDMSKVASMMEMMGGNNEEMDAAMAEMVREFEKTRDEMAQLEGISNVKMEADKKKLVFTTSYDFEDLAALNRGMNRFFNHDKEVELEPIEFFTYSGGKLIRTNKDIMADALTEAMNDDQQVDMDMSTVFADVYFETTLKFERGYKKVSNEAYTAPNKNEIRFKKFLFNDRDLKKSIGVSVTTKM